MTKPFAIVDDAPDGAGWIVVVAGARFMLARVWSSPEDAKKRADKINAAHEDAVKKAVEEFRDVAAKRISAIGGDLKNLKEKSVAMACLMALHPLPTEP